jgi:hypothetical protein
VWKPQRKDILLVAGLIGIFYEAMRVGPERPTLLLVYAAMVGLPLVLRADEHRQNGKDGE